MIIGRTLLFLPGRPEIIRRNSGEDKRESDEALAQIEKQLMDNDSQTAEAKQQGN
jgi:hypothetical protein